jgi:hypothetical protein
MSGTSGTTNDTTFTPTQNSDSPFITNLAACVSNLNGWSGGKPIFVTELGLGIPMSNVIAYVMMANQLKIGGLAPTYFLGNYNSNLNTVGYWNYAKDRPSPNGAAYIATMFSVNRPAAAAGHPKKPRTQE